MEWAAWQPLYDQILADFQYSRESDEEAARAAHPLALDRWHLLNEMPERVAIVGCGPSLESMTDADLGTRQDSEWLLAADGATSRLRELNRVPNVVVTDLDGNLDDLRWADRAGAILVVHVHGDNRQACADFIPQLTAPLLTIQSDPSGLEPMRNFGGFTDGDRAAHLAAAFGATRATMLAFETGAPPGRYSHQFNPATKSRKLAWAQQLLDGLSATMTLDYPSLHASTHRTPA